MMNVLLVYLLEQEHLAQQPKAITELLQNS